MAKKVYRQKYFSVLTKNSNWESLPKNLVAQQPLRGMELQEMKHKKDYRILKIHLERPYS